MGARSKVPAWVKVVGALLLVTFWFCVAMTISTIPERVHVDQEVVR